VRASIRSTAHCSPTGTKVTDCILDWAPGRWRTTSSSRSGCSQTQAESTRTNAQRWFDDPRVARHPVRREALGETLLNKRGRIAAFERSTTLLGLQDQECSTQVAVGEAGEILEIEAEIGAFCGHIHHRDALAATRIGRGASAL
jgi:hypothetical protein